METSLAERVVGLTSRHQALKAWRGSSGAMPSVVGALAAGWALNLGAGSWETLNGAGREQCSPL